MPIATKSLNGKSSRRSSNPGSGHRAEDLAQQKSRTQNQGLRAALTSGASLGSPRLACAAFDVLQ